MLVPEMCALADNLCIFFVFAQFKEIELMSALKGLESICQVESL